MSKEVLSDSFSSHEIRKRLIRAVVGSSGFRIINLLLSFVVSLLLTRTQGAEGYGIYTYAMSWVMLLNLVGSLGCEGLVVREVASNKVHQQWGLINGLLKWSSGLILSSSLATAIIFALIVLSFQGNGYTETSEVLLIALLLIPIKSMTVLRQSTLRGFGHILQGQLPESLLQPICFLVFLASIYIFGFGDLPTKWVMLFRVASSGIAFIIGAWLLYRIIPTSVKQAHPEFQTQKWIPSILALLFIAGTGIIYTRSDAIMLGLMAGPSSVGIYAIALRGANFVLMSQQIGAKILGPDVAGLHASGNIERLQELTTKSTRVVMVYALPVALMFIIFGSWYLSIFGEEFTHGRNVLIILCLTKLLNAASGPVGVLLTMTHHERDNAIAVGVGAILNLVANFLLIPPFGAEGAAIATGLTSVSVNLYLAAVVYRRLGVNCTILG